MGMYIYERDGYKIYNELSSLPAHYRDSWILGSIQVTKDGKSVRLDRESAARFLESIPAGFHNTSEKNREHFLSSYCDYLRPSDETEVLWEYKMVIPFTD